MDKHNLISVGGIFFLFILAWLFSTDRRNLNKQVIFWGMTLQLAMAFFIFYLPIGSKFFLLLNDVVIKILNSSTAGAEFVFGRLALSPGATNAAGETSLGFILAFQAFPTIIFFSALISILYYYNILPRIIRAFSYVFTKLMKISGAESLVAASNIFVGIESILTVRPHLREMTPSEFCTVLAVGMATVASNVLAFYVFILQGVFPTIAAHLISASLLSAPAALVMSKIIYPESEEPVTLGVHIEPYYEKDSSLFEAVINGAQSGVKMIVGIVALLIAVLGLVALVDLFIGGFGNLVNHMFGTAYSWSLKNSMGAVFYPLTLLIGIPAKDAPFIANLIGERLIVTEVVAYQDLAVLLKNNVLAHTRSAVMGSYALCGFAHLASMAIFVGGLSALTPSRTQVITEVAWRALLAATLACLMTACMAGLFFTESSLLFDALNLQ